MDELDDELLVPCWLYDESQQANPCSYMTQTNELKYTDAIVVKRLYDLAKIIHDVFTEVGVKYWSSGGTTLGCVRHKGLIPWDDDLDVCVHKKDVSIVLTKAKDAFDSKGVRLVEATFGYRTFHKTDSVPLLDHRYPFCDIFVMKSTGDGKCYIADGCGRTQWPEEVYCVKNTVNIEQMPFGNFVLNCPSNAEKYLDQVYGDTWRTEGVTHNYDHIIKRYIKPVKFNLTKELCQLAQPFQ